jgi:hypothetical protein
MTTQWSIDEIKQEHSKLYERAIRDGRNSKPLEADLKKVEELLNQLTVCSQNVSTIDDYRWLSQAALQWQVVYSSTWNIAKTVEIPRPPRALLQPLPSDRALSETELEDWQRKHADYLGLLRFVEQRRESSPEEMEWDWHQAQVILVSDILDGFPNFAGRIAAKSYWRLEEVWLKDVKRIRAYFIWEGEGKKVFDPEEKNYDRACEHIRDMLVKSVKAQAIEFGVAKAYLEGRYLTGGRVVHEGAGEKCASAKVLIATKAERIRARRKKTEWNYVEGSQNDLTNWLRAETYMKLFYENIIPAVVNKDQMSVLRVLKAFQYSKAPENCWWVINGFETALAIYFLDPEVIKGLWKDSEADPEPASYIDSSVPVSWGSREFYVPAICKDSFTFDGARIVFRGVMADAQKEALFEALKEEDYRRNRKDIELLCHRSRLIPRKTTL